MKDKHPALFEVYDPVTRLWKVLPNPPFTTIPKTCYYLGNPSLGAARALGHKLLIMDNYSKWFVEFDTRSENWRYLYPVLNEHVCGFAKFNNFLIGIPQECEQVCAYPLNSDGDRVTTIGQGIESSIILPFCLRDSYQ